MKPNKVVSLTEYKIRRFLVTKKEKQPVAEPKLPGADRLWGLLDRNISLAVWLKAQ